MNGSWRKAQGSGPMMRRAATVAPALLTAISVLATVANAGRAAAQPPVQGQSRPGQSVPPAAQTSKPTTGTASLKGQVFAADSGAALGRVRVAVSGPVRRTVTTDANGRWEAKQLPAGRYEVTATKAPWVTLQFGQRHGLETGKPIDLTDGQAVEKVDFRLPKGGVIAGRVVDDIGEPAAFIRVNALRLQFYNGRRQLVRSGISVQTDDIGQYRLYGLPPGTYYVGTDGTTWGGSGISDDPGISFAPTYFPGTIVPSDAQPVVARSGQDRPGVDFGQVMTRLARLSGLVVDHEGVAVPDRSVLVVPDTRGPLGSTGGISRGGARTGPDGRWSVENVSPGNYVVASIPRPSDATAPLPQIGLVAVTVAGQDIDGLVIRTTPGARVAGLVEFEGGDPPTVTPGVRVALEEGTPGIFGLPGDSKVRDDWSFEVTGISPGERMFRLTGLPDGLALKSVFIEGSNVIDAPRKFDGTEDLSGVRLVVTRRIAEVAGGVVDDKARPVRDYSVLVFSTDSSKWGGGTRHRATARPDQNGRYKATGLPPGEYFAIALDYLNPGEADDPEFLADLEARATKIMLGEGELKALDLKLSARGQASN
jgi:hypothetical protein